jgi:hypothetical protein
MKLLFSAFLMVLLPFVVSADTDHSKFTQHYEESLFKITKNRHYSVEMVLKEKVLKLGKNAIDLILHDSKDRDVVGATLTVTPWMPDMGHGVSEKPVVEEKGGGLYKVNNVVISMSGRWELRITVAQDGTEDSTVFEFKDIKKGHDHAMRAPAAGDMDLSVTRLSHKKLFSVTYESLLDPLRINRIHSWKLTIKTADGEPVIGATVTVDGDMPEHGHGLPTQPEVSEEIGQGVYLVEGLKFSMPGWWVMDFHIRKNDQEDTVTFNVQPK